MSVVLRCTNPCGDICTLSRTCIVEIDPNECSGGAASASTGTDALLPGDLDSSGVVHVFDLVTLAAEVSKREQSSSLASKTRAASHSDVNCDGVVNEDDITRLSAYVFRSGAPPCDPTAAAAPPAPQKSDDAPAKGRPGEGGSGSTD